MLGKTTYETIKAVIETAFDEQAAELHTKLDKTEELLEINKSMTPSLISTVICESLELYHQDLEMRLAKLEKDRIAAVDFLDDGPFVKE